MQNLFRPKLPVSYAALTVIEQELEHIQQVGVLQPVNYSTWNAPIVTVKKATGKFRICVDFSTSLNAALDTHQHPLPVPEDVFVKLNGGTCFAKLDLPYAYLKIDVAEESRELLTSNTHRSLCQFTRLPCGVKIAPAIFQQTMDTIRMGTEGAAAYLGDIIIIGLNPDELLQRLETVRPEIWVTHKPSYWLPGASIGADSGTAFSES
ncbi:unnamed protein product [Schistocephalus solidus]|uniref:Reverse transcriptase domain-containing protein n=1 Tax=Schistocephalus solidus TaxID=70667 RepID=A0A183SZC2_SCHSO|nr:unnamed protein product [Schistocephalus solidus]